MLSLLVRKAFEFAKSFLKPASSNPLLLLDNRFLGAAPRAFESRPEPTCRFWKPARAKSPILKASQSQLTDFVSRPEPTRWFWKPARAYLPGFQKLFANSKAFRAKRQRIFFYKTYRLFLNTVQCYNILIGILLFFNSNITAKNLLIQYKIKGTVKQILNIRRTFS